MENGRGLYTPVVFTLEDLKEIYERDAHGTKGMWAFHTQFHPGHMQCSKRTNERCDWVVGVLWNNFAEGTRWMLGDSIDIDTPIYSTDIEVLKNSSDVVMVFSGDYHPYKKHWNKIQELIKKDFPDELLEEHNLKEQFNLYSSLIYSVAVRYVIHDVFKIRIDYHAQCGKDIWRYVYRDWLKERYALELDIDVDAERDEYGNVYSGMKNKCPKEYTDRIKKPLLLQTHKSLEEVNEYIKDIPELKALNFSIRYGWIHSKFEFAGKHWWTEGLKCK